MAPLGYAIMNILHIILCKSRPDVKRRIESRGTLTRKARGFGGVRMLPDTAPRRGLVPGLKLPELDGGVRMQFTCHHPDSACRKSRRHDQVALRQICLQGGVRSYASSEESVTYVNPDASFQAEKSSYQANSQKRCNPCSRNQAANENRLGACSCRAGFSHVCKCGGSPLRSPF